MRILKSAWYILGKVCGTSASTIFGHGEDGGSLSVLAFSREDLNGAQIAAELRQAPYQ